MDSKLLKHRARNLAINLRCLFPTTRRFREAELNKVRALVSYYQPLIEERTNVNLGNIGVSDKSELSEDIIRTITLRDFSKQEILTQKLSIPPQITYLPKYLGLCSITPIANWVLNRKAYMAYRDSTLYVDVKSKLRDYLQDTSIAYEDDQPVIHELSHALWEKLNPNFREDEEKNFQRLVVWNEGFATYCAFRYFADVLPKKLKFTELRVGTVYYEGFKKIENVLKREGPEIFLEIPKRWREL
jgi:hypothetical protein